MGRDDDDPALGEIDLDRDRLGEGQQQRLAPGGRRDFQDVAGAEIAQGDDACRARRPRRVTASRPTRSS